MRNLAILSLVLTGIAATALAHEYKAGDMTIDHPWARETAASQPNGAAYFTIENPGTAPDRLLRAEGKIAKSVQLHTHLMEDGVMKMRPVEAIDVPAEGEAMLEPGGLHVMLMGLTQPLVEGERFPLTLVFENAGPVEVEVKVEDIAGPADAHAEHGASTEAAPHAGHTN